MSPRLTIGLPVRDGAQFLSAAIDSLLKQTFTDFELILSDNASTDATEQICQDAARDPRVRYHRFDENVGASRNFNFVLEEATGEYFKWAAHDDVCAYPLAERCIAELDRDSNLVVCHSKTGRLDAENNVKGEYESELSFDHEDARQRFRDVITKRHFCWSVFGVMRTDVLKQTQGIGAYVGSDRNLLAELALRGKIHLLPDVLFYRRDHPGSSVRSLPDERSRLAWFDPRRRDSRSYPTWRRMREYVGSIRRSPLTFTEKAGCYAEVLQWCGSQHHTGPRNARKMLSELLG